MTIKAIAEFTGKNKTTIQRWIAKTSNETRCKMHQAAESQISAEFTIDEVEEILTAGTLSKDAVKILMENARRSKEIEAPTQSGEVLQMFKAMIDQNQQFMSAVINRLDRLESKEPKQLALPESPKIKPRALLRQLVNDYTNAVNISHQEAWNELYKQFYYRCNENIKIKAKNLKIIPLDYLEQENKLLTACSIMKDLINE